MQVLNERDFLNLLKSRDSLNHEKIVVTGIVDIDNSVLKLESIHLKDIVFNDMVYIRKFENKESFLTTEKSTFLGGLAFEDNTVRNIHVAYGKAKWIHMYDCQTQTACVENVSIEGSLDLSGLNVAERLILSKDSFQKLELLHSAGHRTISANQVTTNDLITAIQFRLLGVPVIMSTEDIRKLTDQAKKLLAVV